MAYSFGHLDDELDSLSLNYTDGVPIKISERFRADYDFGEVEEILRKNPNVLLDDVAYDCSLERQVLDQFEAHKVQREERKSAKKERIRKYEEKRQEELELKRMEEEEKALEDERKRLAEIEAENLKAEAERKQLEEEAETKRLEQEAHLKMLQDRADELAAAVEVPPTDSPEDSPENLSPPNDTNESSNEPIEESSDDPVNAAPTSSFPETNKEINVIGTQSNTPRNVVINFSEFEDEADPFADLELKTINDMEELQSISQTVSQQQQQQQRQQQQQQQQHPQQQQQLQHPPQNQALSSLHGFNTQGALNSIPNYAPPYSAAGASYAAPSNRYQTPYQFSFPNPQSSQQNHPPQSSQHMLGASGATPTTPPVLGQMYMRNATVIPPSGQSDPRNIHSSGPYNPYNPYQPRPSSQQPQPPATRMEKLKDPDNNPPPGELKPSRSLGDMITELQNEARIVQEAKRKSSRTPPLRPASTSTGMENWSPWPDLEPSSSSVNGMREPDPLLGLDPPQVEICQQLHEMGFPLSRLAVGVKAVGLDTQKIINFCLVVDQLVEDGHAAVEAEKAASLHDADVEASKKHLETFGKLSEIGFPSKDIHEALVEQKGDYQAALEVLIS